jgi:TetR/AcrR family transcriptional regulator, transcriptional repressor for nem operon
MRYPSDQKAKAKAAIVQAGVKALREKGFNGIGVDGLAASAGVTSGAFYSNFPGKEDLLREVIETYVGHPFVGAEEEGQGSLKDQLTNYVRMYVSAGHRLDPANGCVMPVLSADVARSSLAVRQSYQTRIHALIAKMARALDGKPADGERRAWSILAMMVGSISIARAMPDEAEAGKVLDAVLDQALSMVEQS